MVFIANLVYATLTPRKRQRTLWPEANISQWSGIVLPAWSSVTFTEITGMLVLKESLAMVRLTLLLLSE